MEALRTLKVQLGVITLYTNQDLVLLGLKKHRSISPNPIHMQFTEIFSQMRSFNWLLMKLTGMPSYAHAHNFFQNLTIHHTETYQQ